MDPENDETQAMEETMETKTNEADLQMAHNNQSSPKYSVAPTENAVRTFMARQYLTQYTEALVNQGYDDLTVLRYLPHDEVLKVANLIHMKPGHQAKFAWALAEDTNELQQESKHKRKRGKKRTKKKKEEKERQEKAKMQETRCRIEAGQSGSVCSYDRGQIWKHANYGQRSDEWFQ